MQLVVYCFAYGENIVPLDGVTPKYNPIINVVFVVNDTELWHSENRRRNARHYSGLMFFGIGTLTKVQEDYGGLVYVNTARVQNVTVRYGVMCASDFTFDLQTWATMYIAGRMLQPVVTLKQSFDKRILDALEDNMVMAVHTAMLLLPEKFTERRLYERIVQLSYEGDFGMPLSRAESLSKSIVAAQFPLFHRLYISILLAVQKWRPRLMKLQKDNVTWVQSTRPEAIFVQLTEIPSTPLKCMYYEYVKKIDPYANAVQALKNISVYSRERRAQMIRDCISDQVFKHSFLQGAKNVCTRGVIKSLCSAAEKFAKATKSVFIGCCNEMFG